MTLTLRQSDFKLGFLAVVPLWIGFLPFAISYALLARTAGLSIWETQLMSLTVFSGGAQFIAANMFLQQANLFSVVLTTFLLNARHLLYGLSVSQNLKLGPLQRSKAAWVLTDEAFGVTANAHYPSYAYLMGASMSVFVSWNVFTLIGALLGSSIPDPLQYGVDFVFPLAFLALLMPTLKNSPAFIVAAFSALLALLLQKVLHLQGGVSVLLVGIFGSMLGAALTFKEKA
ncbi:AzlC family ABC transporter permease [Deinococcus roseus]|uniref:Branched-chain amino acid permease n=1 Tax=Deinococcus roseus TaxID=392414 RepID=A0ABQ2D1Z9_9DEIO|nr:AzlC family ABC transporter permease [Deinococcus roseus]GGJ38642.1 branched-chain amino acid permease [Deinococcus roseus]